MHEKHIDAVCSYAGAKKKRVHLPKHVYMHVTLTYSALNCIILSSSFLRSKIRSGVIFLPIRIPVRII